MTGNHTPWRWSQHTEDDTQFRNGSRLCENKFLETGAASCVWVVVHE